VLSVSEPTKKRLIHLSRLLENSGESWVTSNTIAAWTGWSRATIRKDVSLLGINCGAARGYDRLALRDSIRELLGVATEAVQRRCCIVGLGRFGETLLRYSKSTEYEGFKKSGFVLAAGFDQNVNRIEILTADFPLYPASRLEEIIQKQHIEYAILATNEKAAPVMAKRLVFAGIKGIVNATPAALAAGASVRVENISVITALENVSALKKR
jgi:redox-sensing transcriptional repressor